LNTIEVSNLTI